MEELRKTGDQHQIEALYCIGLYMHEYLHITIIGNNIKIISATSSGLKVLQSYVEELRKTGEQHEIEALYCIGIYMHESLHITIIGNNIKIISATSSGLEVLTCVFEVISMVFFEHMEHMKADLKSIKLVEFPG